MTLCPISRKTCIDDVCNGIGRCSMNPELSTGDRCYICNGVVMDDGQILPHECTGECMDDCYDMENDQ